MRFKDFNRVKTYFIRLDQGEEIITSLASFVKEKGLQSAWLNGIGSVSDVELALYNGKEYVSFSLKQDLELVSSQGNLAFLNGEPVIHLHCIVSDEKGTTWSGHLNHGIISYTGEFIIFAFDSPLLRGKDEKTGLNLTQPEEIFSLK